MTRLRRARILAVATFVAAVVLLAPYIVGQLYFALGTKLFFVNMRILYIFFPLRDPQLFPHDYAAGYYSSLWIPAGYYWLQALWAQFADPNWLNRLLPPFLFFATAPFVFFAGRRLGGTVNGWATVLLYLCSSIYPFHMTGGMAHAFIFPFLWAGVAALLARRPLALAVATILSAGFYPVASPVLGLTLAFWMLFPARMSPGVTLPAWLGTPARRFLFLAAAGLATALMLAPMIFVRLHADYGRSIVLFKENAAFPESGPEGIHNLAVTQMPVGYFFLVYLYQNSVRLGAEMGLALTLASSTALLAGLGIRLKEGRCWACRLAPFLCAVALCFFTTLYLDSATAYRFFYPMPVLASLLLPLALRRLCRRFLPAKGQAIAFVALILGLMACMDEFDPIATRYQVEMQPFQQHALDFIATLPKDVMTAGWPGSTSGRIAENVPYFARRQTLVTWETHGSMHTKYVLAMRARMNAIVDAYLARDLTPVKALRDRFHVDYLIVNEADFTGGEAPFYFAPFGARAVALWEKDKTKPFILPQLVKDKAVTVYSRDGIDIIDLKKL